MYVARVREKRDGARETPKTEHRKTDEFKESRLKQVSASYAPK